MPEDQSRRDFLIHAPMKAAVLYAIATGRLPDQRSQPTSPTPTPENQEVLREPPIEGVNLTHISFGENGEWDDSAVGILTHLHEADNAAKVESMLTEMKNNGVQSLRLLIWNIDKPFNDKGEMQGWGVIPSEHGFEEPYISNLRNYLSLVKKVGFKRMTITFAPQWSNNPNWSKEDGDRGGKFDPTKLEKNWAMIKATHNVAEEVGVPGLVYDLLNEGGPSDADASKTDAMAYIAEIRKRYEQEYKGNKDTTVGFIAPHEPVDGQLDRLRNIVQAFGKNQPDWYHFSFYPTGTVDDAFKILEMMNEELNKDGHLQPWVVEEMNYNDPISLQAIKRFEIAHPERKILEVLQWPIKRGYPTTNISPPYNENEVQAVLGSEK